MKERLDARLVREGAFPSRETAQRAVMAGLVRIGGVVASKPGTFVSPEAVVEVARPEVGFVSRGGLKVAHALEHWAIPVAGRIALDVGASTGGFTDALLQRGASRVHAIDVGYGQLAWALRQDPRVHVLERTNIRYLTPDRLYAAGESPADLAVIDVSFIGLAKVLPAVACLLAPRADIIALVKPQFEAGRADVGKKGVVRDPAVRERCVAEVARVASDLGFVVHGHVTSPITGPEGNVEFLSWYSR